METQPYIDVTKLKRNTAILLETAQTVYEITVTGPKSGSMNIHGGLRFIRSTKVKFLGSLGTGNGEDTLTANCIEKGKKLQLSYKDKTGEHTVSTSPVVSARVTAPDKSWYYDVIEKHSEQELVAADENSG